MHEQLTGRTRHRAAVFGIFRKRVRLVLQVETVWSDGPPDTNGMPEYLAGTGWRDARPEDATLEDRAQTAHPQCKCCGHIYFELPPRRVGLDGLPVDGGPCRWCIEENRKGA